MKKKKEELYKLIIEEIKKDVKITEEKIAYKYSISERTVRRYIKELKDKKKVQLIRDGKIREWKIL